MQFGKVLLNDSTEILINFKRLFLIKFVTLIDDLNTFSLYSNLLRLTLVCIMNVFFLYFFRTYFVRHGCLFDVLLTLQFVPTTVFLIRDYTLIKKCLFLLWIKFIKPMILDKILSHY